MISSFPGYVPLLVEKIVLFSQLDYGIQVQLALFLLEFQPERVFFLLLALFWKIAKYVLKILVSICFSTQFGIGNMLLRKVTLERISVFNNIAFPLRERCLLESYCNYFSKFDVHNSQLKVLVFYRSFVKYIPSILMESFWLVICMFFIIWSRL